MFKHYGPEAQEYTFLFELIKGFAVACRSREPRRLQKVFAESILSIIIG